MRYKFPKGYTPWNKGKKMPKKWIQKRSLLGQGKNNPGYIDGRAMRPYYCIDCGIKTSRGSIRCERCNGVNWGRNHRGENHPRWKGGLIKKECLICKKEYWVKGYENKYRKTCSRKCRGKYNSSYFIGEKSNNWKGGITPLYRRLKQCNAYYEWKKGVFNKNGKSCQKCGVTKNLEVHHIKPFFKYIELRYDVNNGMVLCRECHKKEPMGRKIVLIYDESKR